MVFGWEVIWSAGRALRTMCMLGIMASPGATPIGLLLVLMAAAFSHLVVWKIDSSYGFGDIGTVIAVLTRPAGTTPPPMNLVVIFVRLLLYVRQDLFGTSTS